MGLFDKIKIDSRFKTKLTKSDIKAVDKAIGLNDFDFEYQRALWKVSRIKLFL